MCHHVVLGMDERIDGGIDTRSDQLSAERRVPESDCTKREKLCDEADVLTDRVGPLNERLRWHGVVWCGQRLDG
jgi:hypothetical protein